ncbi:hypothetical protein CYLTODRAFT_494697 [Cylindrobasidium torrendii FP15055 ss-10]|uniref:Uncharacterized protein n=1 Tax=Cylindrobasidium torrendii FP15055 ss-10 TaxID=1314674 RepID=A0A0D7AWI0_9AGAR|nr:hypothetical protein CYLTODRAFT_494697 [Cylindrobasidium torrendii FP15055 ss-10]
MSHYGNSPWAMAPREIDMASHKRTPMQNHAAMPPPYQCYPLKRQFCGDPAKPFIFPDLHDDWTPTLHNSPQMSPNYHPPVPVMPPPCIWGPRPHTKAVRMTPREDFPRKDLVPPMIPPNGFPHVARPPGPPPGAMNHASQDGRSPPQHYGHSMHGPPAPLGLPRVQPFPDTPSVELPLVQVPKRHRQVTADLNYEPPEPDYSEDQNHVISDARNMVAVNRKLRLSQQAEEIRRRAQHAWETAQRVAYEARYNDGQFRRSVYLPGTTLPVFHPPSRETRCGHAHVRDPALLPAHLEGSECPPVPHRHVLMHVLEICGTGERVATQELRDVPCALVGKIPPPSQHWRYNEGSGQKGCAFKTTFYH